MTAIDLSQLSVSQLRDLELEIEQEVKSKRQQELLEAKAAIDEVLEKYGFDLEEVMNAKATKTVKPKYKNPNNDLETWSGRGRKPRWVIDIIESGVDIETCAI